MANDASHNPQPVNKRNAWRLASFINSVQKFLGKDADDVAWARSPAVPEQLLSCVQGGLVANTTPNWTFPPIFSIIRLIVRVQELFKLAEETLFQLHNNYESAQTKVEQIHAENSAIRRAARPFWVCIWTYLCKAALHSDLDYLDYDSDGALERALRSKRVRRSSRSTDPNSPLRRILIEKDKQDDEAPISSENSAKLNEYVLLP